jgi:hypothetical protein
MGVSVDRRSRRVNIAFVIGAKVEAAVSLELQQNPPAGHVPPALGIGLTTAATQNGGRLRRRPPSLGVGTCVPIRCRQKPLVSGFDARFIHACSACDGAFSGAE